MSEELDNQNPEHPPAPAGEADAPETLFEQAQERLQNQQNTELEQCEKDFKKTYGTGANQELTEEQRQSLARKLNALEHSKHAGQNERLNKLKADYDNLQATQDVLMEAAQQDTPNNPSQMDALNKAFEKQQQELDKKVHQYDAIFQKQADDMEDFLRKKQNLPQAGLQKELEAFQNRQKAERDRIFNAENQKPAEITAQADEKKSEGWSQHRKSELIQACFTAAHALTGLSILVMIAFVGYAMYKKYKADEIKPETIKNFETEFNKMSTEEQEQHLSNGIEEIAGAGGFAKFFNGIKAVGDRLIGAAKNALGIPGEAEEPAFDPTAVDDVVASIDQPFNPGPSELAL